MKTLHFFKIPLLSVLLLFLLNAGSPKPKLSPGKKAKDFSLPATDGKLYSLEDFKNVKGYIVVFTCNTCPFAQAYEQRIIDIHNKYAPLGMPVVAINANDPVSTDGESMADMKNLAATKKYPFVYLQDLSQKTAKAYGALRTPHIFVLNAERRVMYIGAIDDNFEEPSQVKEKYLENALNQFLAGQEISLKTTKAIGCGIKWKKK